MTFGATRSTARILIRNLRHRHGLPLTRLAVLHREGRPDTRERRKSSLRACLQRGGGPQLGEVTRLAVVEKWPAFTCKLTIPGLRGDVTRRCCVVDRHVNRENGGRRTHFGGQCSFPLIICSRCNISVLWLFTVTFDDLARLQM